MIRKKIHLLLAGMLLAGCSSQQYQMTDDGVVINVKQKNKTETQKVRLQVLRDEVIHVSATPEKEFPKDSSLIIVPGIKNVPFTVDTSHKDSVMVVTQRLKVLVSKKDGGVNFKDKDGKVILTEKQGGGKTFRYDKFLIRLQMKLFMA
jgi:alpha-D-xyloside xylohydrolase